MDDTLGGVANQLFMKDESKNQKEDITKVFRERTGTLENLLTEMLRDSNQVERDELENMLRIWRMRVMFVDALAEEAILSPELLNE